MMAEPQLEHRWLQKLVGEWTFEMETPPCPDPAQPGAESPPMKVTGVERVRSLQGIWFLGEGESEMPGGVKAQTLLTLGYDPEKKRYVGSWIGSMMPNMWVYEGEVDASGKVLTLNTTGPSMTAPGQTARYKDVIEFKSDDYRTLTSHILGEDGKWTQFMQAHYRRR